MTVQFRHYRILQLNEHTYDYEVHNLGGFTFAFHDVDENSVNGDVKIGIAVCSREDNFERSKGRQVAVDRLAKKGMIISREDFNKGIICQEQFEDRDELMAFVKRIDDHFGVRLKDQRV